MAKSVYVGVNANCDELGNLIPTKIMWEDGREFVIERVIHSCPVDESNGCVVKYTVLIAGKQRHLYHDHSRWYVVT